VLKLSIRVCYSFLKGVIITLYQFLEEQTEQPPLHVDSACFTSSDSVTAGLVGGEFGGALGQGFGVAREDVFRFGDALEKQGSPSLDESGLASSVETVHDLASSSGFFRVEGYLRVGADVPA
jgi:hypothetical protein